MESTRLLERNVCVSVYTKQPDRKNTLTRTYTYTHSNFMSDSAPARTREPRWGAVAAGHASDA